MARYSEKILFILAVCHIVTAHTSPIYVYATFLALYGFVAIYGGAKEGIRIHVILQHLGALTQLIAVSIS